MEIPVSRDSALRFKRADVLHFGNAAGSLFGTHSPFRNVVHRLPGTSQQR